MTYDPEQILAEEFQLMLSKEPGFNVVNGDLRHWSGLVNQFSIDIVLDEMHPFVSPVTKIRGSLKHPNINSNGTLSLQMLDKWEPRYRIPDIVAAIRRLFSHATPSSSPRVVSSSSSPVIPLIV